MNDSIENDEVDRGSSIKMPLWLKATVEDAKDVDFNFPISESNSCDCYDISRIYSDAANASELSAPGTPAGRVLMFLSAVAGMHFKPHEKNEPFGPMFVSSGQRSAIVNDFRNHVDLLKFLANKTINVVLRARLSDVCWVIERKNGDLARSAIIAYTDIVERMKSGKLISPYFEENSDFYVEYRDYLRRALCIGWAIGMDKPEVKPVKNLVKEFKEKAISVHNVVAINWFCNIDLDFRISDPVEIGNALNKMMTKGIADITSSGIVDLWKLAAQAFQLGKRESEKNRCLEAAAEQLVIESEAMLENPILCAHVLSSAIAHLRGLPGKKDRRTELRHKLVDVQSRIPEELNSFSQEIDLSDIINYTENRFSDINLIDRIFLFSDIEKSPKSDLLKKQAIKSIQENPLSSLFQASYMDREGKVIFRSQGAGFTEGEYDSAISRQIEQGEEIRRKLVAHGKIDIARRIIISDNFISDETFSLLLQYSPFVPDYLISTFSRGFARFFQGDFVSSLYILTPLLENSLRHVLKGHGHDVTIFDDVNQTQQDRTISSLFEQMRRELNDVFTADIIDDIERLFLSKPGPHLRHTVAHGLLDDGVPYGADAIYGCWLIFRLCIIPLYSDYVKLKEILEGKII